MTNFEETKLKEFYEMVGKPPAYHTEDHQNIQGKYTEKMFKIDDLKKFLLSALAQQREELVKEIERLRLNEYLFLNSYWEEKAKQLDNKPTYQVYNQALNDFLDSLTSSVPEEKKANCCYYNDDCPICPEKKGEE